MINSIQTPVTGVSTGIPLTTSITAPAKQAETIKSVTSSDTPKISTLSRQLSESVARADSREKSMSRSQLGDFAKRVNREILHVIDDVSKITKNQKKPDTNDPELLERDRQATDFLIKKFSGDNTGKNPFSGLSREQLTVILYDEGGPFSVNERRAAWCASEHMEQQWSGKVFADGWAERATGGKTPNYFTEVLAHYRSLPLIEQAQYPEDYEAKLQAWLDDALSSEEKPEEEDFLSLVDIIAKTHKPDKKAEESDETKPAADVTTNSLSPDACPTPADVPHN
ncbi:MAG: hypothetical protein ACOH2R_03925 [Pseudomonas sp.]